MPRQTINQLKAKTKKTKTFRRSLTHSLTLFCFTQKDDSFINEHFIPKKANDDRRHSD